MTVKIRGDDNHKKHLTRLRKGMTRIVGKALFAAGNIIEIEAEVSITRGAVSGKNHVASKPGEPPNADTRQLDTSINTVVANDLTVNVVASAPHALPLEFGTSKMAARPFLRPATRKKRREAIELVRRFVSRGTK